MNSIKHVKIYLGIFGLRGYSTYGAIWSVFFARNIFNVSHQTSQIAIEYKLFSAAKLSALWFFLQCIHMKNIERCNNCKDL